MPWITEAEHRRNMRQELTATTVDIVIPIVLWIVVFTFIVVTMQQ